MVTRIGILVAVLSLSGVVWAQTTQPVEAESPTSRPAMPSIIQTLPDYSGDLAHRKFLTGDWGGARTKLADSGILFELGVTQVLQDNAHGGKDTNNGFRYSGSTDYTLKLDTARMNRGRFDYAAWRDAVRPEHQRQDRRDPSAQL